MKQDTPLANKDVLSDDKKSRHSLTLPTVGDIGVTNVTLENNSLIIIGANGAGKSKLGAWIEENDPQVHRIGAQRSLVFGDSIETKSYEQSQSLLMYGTDKPSNDDYKSHQRRWSPSFGAKYSSTSCMLNDYQYVLSALLSKYYKELEKIRAEYEQGIPYNNSSKTVIDKLITIWKNVFPHRDIQIIDAKVTAKLNTEEYPGKHMSDGERVVLYLIAQALSVPENKKIIIDEPEIHLHNSIINKLWEAIEKERPDCLFIYITHDTQFAACRKDTKKIWVKEYDGKNWDWEEVNEAQLPDQLLLDILGNRKPVIFVEGTPDSYDTRLYSLIFKDYYIVACGSCTAVITNTKAMNNTPQLHHLQCYGIIDRDHRSDHEIEKLKEQHIYPLEVAEVENLFLIPDLLYYFGLAMDFSEKEALQIVNNIKKYIIEDRFKKEKDKQIHDAVVSEIKYRLSIIEFSKDTNDIKTGLEKEISQIDINKLIENITNIFNSACGNNEYEKILKIFNQKNLTKSIGKHWEIDNKKFCDHVLRKAMNSLYADKLLNALSLYMPKEIPRTNQEKLEQTTHNQ